MAKLRKKISNVLSVIIILSAVLGSWYIGYKSGWDDGYNGYEKRVDSVIQNIEKRREAEEKTPVEPIKEHPLQKFLDKRTVVV